MSDSLYIAGTEARSGKSAIVLGVMELLHRKIGRVGFFRPIISGLEERDSNTHLIATHFGLDTPYEKMYGYSAREATDLATRGKPMEVIEGIIKKYNELKETCDFIVCDGTNYATSTAAFEFDINAEISKNLSCPVLLVANGHGKSTHETVRSMEVALESLQDKKCQTIGAVINRTEPEQTEEIVRRLRSNPQAASLLIYGIPENPALARPTVSEVARILGAEVLCGEKWLGFHVSSFTIGAMQIQNLLKRVRRGTLVITAGDRTDVIVACLAAGASATRQNIAGMILTGGLTPDETIMDLLTTSPRSFPVLSVQEDTFPVASRVSRLHTKISPDDDRKITQLLALFEKHVNTAELERELVTTRTAIVTPKMFEYNLIQRAKKKKQHIVLPEGDEERILRAAELLLQREVADITLLGNTERIHEKITQLGLRLSSATIVDPDTSPLLESYARTYYELRKHKGITEENAWDVVKGRNFFATMMVRQGDADAMVSGAVHSTADTIRPALQIIRTKPGVSLVSSVFLMCLEDRVLVYGDCAVNPDPDAAQLAEIAISSAETARTFHIDPTVALLSYSTGGSGSGADVEKVREATRLARDMAKAKGLDLKIEGPIQYDAAVDSAVARTKLPDSEVAGKATVFVFPDLNTGNNTYKAVQRSADAVAVGPILQGLRYPVNDLSRGCTVPDIVNTVAITAVQAQAAREEKPR
ncbi:phosphate acetyltransferase [Desulfoluna butyratoxydans]|uniref:Phosphate acetyltransferase n=1 Tax=Desulfoluna butyratoxydans TaxID=231438 RepID=A0A4U8YJA2_9BACT|nr:phosphate acetyltransferase [Desulfoluna butyratoxydans]VFQ43119.1 phosphate acetyl/butaryl transferase [Desulfoluna butyratoxydans]